MHIEVLYFGVLKDCFGVDRDRVELADDTSVAALLRSLETRAAGCSAMLRTIAVAVNREYSAQARTLCDGDEVALLPPVSGGGQ